MYPTSDGEVYYSFTSMEARSNNLISTYVKIQQSRQEIDLRFRTKDYVESQVRVRKQAFKTHSFCGAVCVNLTSTRRSWCSHTYAKVEIVICVSAAHFRQKAYSRCAPYKSEGTSTWYKYVRTVMYKKYYTYKFRGTTVYRSTCTSTSTKYSALTCLLYTGSTTE